MTESIGINHSLYGVWGALLSSSNTIKGELSILRWHDSDTQIHWAAHLDTSGGPFRDVFLHIWHP